ncbi:MAG: hypothetical protein D6828_04880, partial [Nitrospirae bacterium]
MKIKDKNIIGFRYKGRLVGVNELPPMADDSDIEPITYSSEEGKMILRHSAAHVMAHAVKELFPNTKLAIGPATEEGFYYDFDIDRTLTPDDLTSIESKMRELVKKNSPFIRKELKKELNSLISKWEKITGIKINEIRIK